MWYNEEIIDEITKIIEDAKEVLSAHGVEDVSVTCECDDTIRLAFSGEEVFLTKYCEYEDNVLIFSYTREPVNVRTIDRMFQEYEVAKEHSRFPLEFFLPERK